MTTTVTIVGASVAGWHTVIGLRAVGFDGDITVVGREPHPPYDRPPLSKGILTGALTESDIRFASEEDVAALDARWILGTDAIALRPNDRAIDLSDGTTLRQDAVVVATGLGAPDHPLLTHLPRGAYQLRTLTDAISAREALASASRVIVVGGGFIGSEVASGARVRGVDVVVLEADDAVGVRALGVHAGRLGSLHAEAGVDVRPKSAVTAVLGRDRVTGVQLEDGSIIEGDAVFLGLGSQPATGWLRGSGLDLAGGVASDVHGRTSIPNVFVAGDVARYKSPWSIGPRRFEHWTSAVDQATAVAHLVTGLEPPAERPPYFWFDVHGHSIQVVGVLPVDSDVDILTDSADAYLAVHRQNGRDVGVFAIDSQREFARARRHLQPPSYSR